ncbi:MAG: hypothetical protein UD759_03765 [Clostridia bacterium]|jgi:hypothetical protein|nr:hypothetical protein [Clostridia bacterium]MEE0841183.1 hypothetical protein [Acutalibacteraceae bacterium]
MRKGIKLTAFLLAVFLVHTFSGCIENEDFVVYGRFKDSYTTDRFEVFCDWEKINPVLDKCDFKEYGLYNAFYDNNDSFPDFEKRMNAIWLNNYPLNDENTNNATLGSAHVSYGARCCNSVESQHHTGEKYFTEPMIQIQLYNPNARQREHEIEPDYLLGYRAVYSLNGELALEEGQWFLEEDKDNFCRHYFDIMLKIIGKGD